MPDTLIVLRHAKSDWTGNVPDFDRPLAGRGRRDAPAAGRWLADNAGAIDLVVCSPAKRARQTWKRVAAELPSQPEVRFEPRLYDEGVGALLDVLLDVPAGPKTVLFVGHNPDLSMLVERLSGGECELRTSSIAVVDLATKTVRATATPRG
ncbi:histidine phosphatase family protein [Amycolatopsis sp. K13G38]|uniref:Histidine phosphatase family protein n=1 Tax=Amycolatopsis acididurans TaxID=2724524 RepID=A0ABX1JAR9_9PSEU|nr:histidine phosphatase family protein [Amycolatopsis acididurans]NKQ56878.1 histidine phosphatase family protein [Amycolatopsis acididurans]